MASDREWRTSSWPESRLRGCRNWGSWASVWNRDGHSIWASRPGGSGSEWDLLDFNRECDAFILYTRRGRGEIGEFCALRGLLLEIVRSGSRSIARIPTGLVKKASCVPWRHRGLGSTHCPSVVCGWAILFLDELRPVERGRLTEIFSSDRRALGRH